MIFIIDTNVESLAVKEGLKLNIPIVAVVDTNSDPTGINFPIPGNDDARRSINLYCDLVKQTILDAQKHIVKKDKDIDETQLEEKKQTEKKVQKLDKKIQLSEKKAKPLEKKVKVVKKSSKIVKNSK
tara:strand:- start:143 stop:523 length:381 start_codon:yes stop_codon:yes gene_type:complete